MLAKKVVFILLMIIVILFMIYGFSKKEGFNPCPTNWRPDEEIGASVNKKNGYDGYGCPTTGQWDRNNKNQKITYVRSRNSCYRCSREPK